MDAWLRLLALSAGGVVGVNARYWVAVGMGRWVDPRFPWATFAINVSGSFAVGFASAALSSRLPHPNARLFVITGFLGGYTTFSAFALETLGLWELGSGRRALAYALGSLAAGLVAVTLGLALARGLLGTPGQPIAGRSTPRTG